jgi:hypothetical protein
MKQEFEEEQNWAEIKEERLYEEAQRKKVRSIWGTEYWDIESDPEYPIWGIKIRNPFLSSKKGWQIGINEKLINMAQKQGVKTFRIEIGNRTVDIAVPNEQMLKEMVKIKYYEDKASMFENGGKMRIYYFNI